MSASYNFYGQDAWKARPNLTVTAGLRWEIVPAPDMVNKRMLVPGNELGDVTPYGPLFQPGSSTTYNDLLANLGSDHATGPRRRQQRQAFLENASITILRHPSASRGSRTPKLWCAPATPSATFAIR